MAKCANQECRKEVGCPCNLMDGLCANCFSTLDATMKNQISVKRAVVYGPQTQPVPPNDEFNNILNSNISQADKLKRINDILEEARKKYYAN